MLIRSDARAIFGIFTFFMLFIFFSNQFNQKNMLRSFVDYHAVMMIKSIPKNKKEHKKWDHLIHRSVSTFNKTFKPSHKSKRSRAYAHKQDHIFLTHAHGEIGSYCFHIPSHLTFEKFTKFAYSFYKEKGIIVSFHKDYTMQTTILNNEIIGYESQTITLPEYKQYREVAVEDFDNLIKNTTSSEKRKRLVDIKEMRPLFDWHLKIPAVGIMTPDDKELPKMCKPLSWLFSTWDLAPNKGAGVKVAIVDTGSAGFALPDQDFTKHPGIVNAPDITKYGLNLVSANGLDPVHQLAILIKQYCEKLDVLSIEDGLVENIIGFLKTGQPYTFEALLLKYGTNIVNNFTKNNSSSSEKDDDKVTLTEALNEILYGEYGILPNKKPGFFTLAKLGSKDVLLEALPTPKIKSNINFMATHGTFTQGVITEIAPNAEYYPIKTLKDNGSTTEASFDHALRVSMLVEADILNLSLKSSESYDPQDEDDILMKQLIDSFDYVVAASGNDGDERSSAYVGKKEAYPARFDSVAFDVGGFKFGNYQYPYGEFSQYEAEIGPKFLAPGFNVLGSAINTKTGEMCKMFMGGTSVAVPVVTGCVTLALGEFKEEFSRETILTVLYESAMKMRDDTSWNNNVSLGMIDIRSGLLCLHTLKEIKDKSYFDLEEHEDYLVKEIFSIIFNNPNTLSRKTKIVDIRSNFTRFREQCLNVKNFAYFDDLLFADSDNPTLSEVVAKIISILQQRRHKLQQSLTRSNQLDLTNKKLFGSDRVAKAIDFNINRDNYWHESIDTSLAGVVA